MTDNTIDEETATEVTDDLEEASEDIAWYQRLGAASLLVALYTSIAVILLAGVKFDYITPDIVINVVVNAGWVVEIVLAALGIAFVVFLFGMTLAALPASLTGALGSIGYAAAKSQGYIDDEE
jgi:hypothetical protein